MRSTNFSVWFWWSTAGDENLPKNVSKPNLTLPLAAAYFVFQLYIIMCKYFQSRKNICPKIFNFNRFRHWAKFMKWSIIQFCFMNVIIGFISIVLYCDVKWREIPQTGVDGLTPGLIKTIFYIFIYIFFQTLIFRLSGWCQPCCAFMLPICSKVFNKVKFWKGSLTRSIKSTGNFPPFFSLFSSQGSNAFFSQPFQRKITLLFNKKLEYPSLRHVTLTQIRHFD